MAPIPTGMLTRKMVRQPRSQTLPVMRSAPMIGPSTVAMPAMPP